MAFVQRIASNRLPEVEIVFIAKFEHASNRFLTIGLLRRGFPLGLQDLLLNQRLKIMLNVHPARLRLRKKACFQFRFEMEGNGHKASGFSLSVPRCSRSRRSIGGGASV